MGFLKGFGIGLIVFVALNFVFSLIVAAVNGVLGFYFLSLAQWENFFYILLGPIGFTPHLILFGGTFMEVTYISVISAFANNFIALALQGIFYLVSPLIAAILTGRFAGGKKNAFLAWFLISLLSAALLLIPNLITYSAIPGSSILTYLLVVYYVLIPGIINGVFYASPGMVVSEAEFY